MAADLFKGMDEVFLKYSFEIEKNIQEQLAWTEHLKNDIEVEAEGTDITISMPLYGWVIEKGRRGWAMPPTEPLVPWIQKKLHKTEEEAIALSYPIALSIYRSCRLPRPWVDESLNMKELMTDIANRIMYNYIRDIEVTENNGEFLQGRIPWNK
jgi:hypothetical protein